MEGQALDDMLRPMLLPDLRVECRARGISPAGGRPALLERVKEHMQATGNYELSALKHLQGSAPITAPGNNYSRPEGQNVGNFLTDKNSSRVLAPPGGQSQINLGPSNDAHTPATEKAVSEASGSPVKTGFASPQPGTQASPLKVENTTPSSSTSSPRIPAAHVNARNNYHRPEGQNVGNFMTDRSSSRVLAPPGGRSNITFG